MTAPLELELPSEEHGLTREEASTLSEVVDEARQRLRRDRRVRRRLPGGGKLFIDGLTPFLAVSRPAADGGEDGVEALVTSLRSYLLTPAERPGVARRILRTIPATMSEELGGALVLEMWVARPTDGASAPGWAFRVHARDPEGQTAREFARTLADVKVVPDMETHPGRHPAEVDVVRTRRSAPMGCEPLLAAPDGDGVMWLGLEVAPLHLDPGSGELFPERLQLLRRELSLGLERALHAWAARCTRFEGAHPHNLGRRTLGRSGRAIDSRLSDVAEAFDLILGVSPVNMDEMWEEFEGSGREHAPRFVYRPLAFDPEELKRTLFHVPIERIEDPLAAVLIREKQEELDLRISMLRNRGRPQFLLGSLQLFGRPDDELVSLARRVFEALPRDERPAEPEACIDAGGFVGMARDEVEHLQSLKAGFPDEIRYRDDIASGILVSRGVLCVNPSLTVSRRRAEALVQHEVGTHMVTWFNGAQQDLRLLRTGLAGYGNLQEGLAVLAEYLTGGLTPSRARTLAARVVAVECLAEGADFVETYRVLVDDLGLGSRGAFGITVRVYRGGGLTKDLQYLQGLRDVLQYLRTGQPVDTLFVGKVGLSHIGTVRELTLRGIIRPPAVLPRYMRDETAKRRLEACRQYTVLDLFREVAA